MLERIIILGLINAGIITATTKLGIRDWIQVRSNKLTYKLISCNFCLSFWMAFMFSAFQIVTGNGYEFLLLPLPAAIITKHLT